MATQDTVSPQSVGSGTAEYDPRTDPKRKARSGDPRWKYGFWPEIGNRDLVECILCGTQVKSGIKRLKEHLVGGYRDALKCEKTTTAIAAEMEAALVQGRRRRALNLDDDDDGVQVVEVQNNANAASQSSGTTVQHPSSGTTSKRKQSALKFANLPPRPKEKEKKSVITMLRKNPEEVVEERHSKNGPAQSSVEGRIRTKEERDEVNMHVANFFYECRIPLNAINSRSLEIMCEAIGQYGPGYRPPSYHEARVPLLGKAVEQVNKIKEKHEAAWKQYGYTLMSDGWTDRRGRHLINFLVNSPEGTFFLESVDASSEVHDAPMLADLLQQRIDLIGRDKVVQVVTDNGANYKAACKLLMERIPTLFWTPCAAHCLDLMLEDIGKMKEFSKPIARARQVTTFIYRHGRLLDAMREKIGGRDLVRPGVTRFATAFLTLRSLHTHKDALKFLFVSDDWTKSKLARTEAGKKVHDTILSTEFWNSVEDCLRASQSLIVLLRIVDGDERPAMPEVQFCMEYAKKKIKENFPTRGKADLLKRILAIIDKRWEDQMNQPLYGAALYLNPNKYFDLKTDDVMAGKLRSAFTEVLSKMVPDQDLQNKIDDQALEYEDLRGSFSNKIAINNIKTKSPSKLFTDCTI